MIEIDLERLAEPPEFDTACRKKGEQWLKDNPKVSRKARTRPRDYWSPFRPMLADGYRDLCGYSAMYEPVGTVDHFLPVDADESLSYEWSNYRFCSGWINSCKKKSVEILDPHLVREGWFEILLPSLQLVVVLERVPEEWRGSAVDTLRRLHLRDDERVLRQRRAWYSMYREGKINLDGLREVAPLIAAAVEKLDAQEVS
ncbi:MULTISPECIES: hypothetical protein [unclassified Pseudomonas]|uniref:hypothetical protein n=1 Tax=unclassified Pseudomonas TaxID=196821 RepID=UPI000D9CE209|nr:MULTISPECIES: hypothetical protein [unclassified Pseudomonas]PYG82123.1 hypothetical protein N428_01073 [Pseudomonas sp. RV120224-01c]PYG85481.1 hypothetical protein N436_01072 [Pseudomonas sp. RV120224-01b]